MIRVYTRIVLRKYGRPCLALLITEIGARKAYDHFRDEARCKRNSEWALKKEEASVSACTGVRGIRGFGGQCAVVLRCDAERRKTIDPFLTYIPAEMRNRIEYEWVE